MGRKKIKDAWGPTVYRVVNIQGTTHSVEPIEGGPTKTVHRTELQPCVRPVRPKPCTKKFPTTQVVVNVSTEAPEADFVLTEEVIPPHSEPNQGAEKDNSVELPAVTTNRERDRVYEGSTDAEGDEIQADVLNSGGECWNNCT